MVKEFIEDKFIVINKKRFDEVSRTCTGALDPTPVKRLEEAIKDFELSYEARTGERLNQKYLVCNRDEPYAMFVLALILGGFITPEQYEKAAKIKYPSKAPVWYAEADLIWKLRPYGEAVKDWIRRDVDSLYTYMVCAIGNLIPEDGEVPDCCESQWFSENKHV